MKTFNILPKARWLVTITLLLSFCIPNVWGAEGDVLKTYNTNSSTFTTGYKRQSGDNFVWWGQKNYLGANNATNHGNLKPTAADLPVVKAQNASATTSTTGLYYCYTSEAVANVGALEIYLSAKSGSSTVNAYIVTSSTAASSGSATWTKVTLSASSANAQGKNVNSAGTYRFTFNATETGAKYYGVVFATSSYWRATGFQMKLIEGASAGCSNAVALSKGTATNGTVNTISSASVATCSGTASDRRVTITITPDDCYDAPTNLTWTKTSGTVSASKQSGPTDNGDGTYSYVYQFAQNDNGAGTFGVTCTAKAAGKTVNFDAGPGSCLTSSLTETCDGSGVTLPAVTATGVCKGWTTFAGWATAAVSDSTTTSVTVYAAGSNFVPASDGQTLYAVYSKAKGGSGFKLSLTVSSTTYYVGKQHGSDNYLSAETNSANAAIFTFDNGYLSYDDSGTKKYISITGNNTSLYTTTAKPAVTWTESGTTTYTYLTSAATRYLAYNGSVNPVRFASYNNNSSYPQYFTKTSAATTYYCSDPNCCTELASINGSFSFTNVSPTSVTVGVPSDYSDKDNANLEGYIFKRYSASTGGTLLETKETNSSSGTTATFNTGLVANTTYYYTITAKHSSSSCNSAETSPRKSYTITSYTVSYANGGGSGTNPGAHDPVLSGTSVTLKSNTFTAPTGKQFAGWNDGSNDYSAGASYSVTANKTMTAQWSCINPTIGTQPASNTYQEGDGPTALSVAATLASGTLTYLWKVSTDNGVNWSNAAGTNNTASYSGASLNTNSVGTLKFKCIVGNSEGGCSVESNVATITITAAANFPNGKTIFIQAHSTSAWSDANNDCVKAWFHSAGGHEAAQSTYWLFDATGGDAGKKLFAAIVPATGNLPYLDIQRFSHNCNNYKNKNGGCSYADANGSNTIRSTGKSDTDNANDDYIRWNVSGVTMNLMSSDAWLTPVASVTDQGAGVWSGTYEYTPSNTSTEYIIATNYNGNIGNTGSNNNVTLSGMTVGSTYNVTATLDIPTHALTMSKTFVKGTVHFDMQSHGSAISDLTNVYAGSKISAPSPAPTDAAYDFGGWFKEAGCTNEWNFASDEVNETMTLYAKWTLKTYAIAYLPGANGTGTVPAGVKNHGESFTLSSSTFSRDHYTQDGWSTSDGGAKVYELGGSYTTNAALILYPHWTPATYTVTWYAGGTAAGNITTAGSPTTSVAYNNKVATLPTNPDGSACDKVFVGWTDDTDYDHGTSLLFTDAAGSPTITGATNFYAVYATESVGNTTLLEEDFSEITTGNSTSTSGSSTTWGRNANFSTGANTYSAGGAVRLGSGSNTGNLTTKQLTAAIGDEITVAFKVKGWSSVEGDISVSGLYSEFTKPSDITYTAVMDGAFESKSVTVTLTSADPYIVIATTAKRAFIDDLVITKSGITYTGHTITCADCGTSVTPTFTAAPAGGTVAVTKGGMAVASGSTVKTCTSQELSVTITPASHYTLTGFTASGLTTGTATISPATNTVLPSTSAQTFTVTVSAAATGTLNLTPTFTEDAHIAINWNVNGVNQSIAATEGLTWVYSGEDLTALPNTPSVPAGCTGTKVFAGWSQKHSDATEQDAAWYDDLFDAYDDPTVPTGITSAKTFYAVFATEDSNPLAGTVMWDEPFTDFSADDVPTTQGASNATVYNSTTLTYACTDGSSTATKIWANAYAGGTSPELLVGKNSGVFTVSNIPTGGQTTLTLTYKTNGSLTVASGTSGVTIGDASNVGNTYTRTITISQSPSATNNFSLSFTTGNSNSRLDDIHLVVPGSSTMTDYLTLCAPSYTITYDKNTSDAVTNLPSPTSVLQSTGSGTLSSTIPIRATYTFVGWSNASGDDNTKNYDAGGSITGVTADKTIYAVWEKTAVEELTLNYSELNKYVGDPAVTLEVTGVTPEGADASVTWSSNNTGVASVVAATGVVTFGTVGTATITATSTVTGTTTAYCYVTVRNKPTATFTDLIHDGNGTDLSDYNLQDVAGTAIVFPTLDDYATPGDNCDAKHYVFVGWTTSDNNEDPEDHLVTSDVLVDDQAKTFYAVWADGVEGYSYTKLTTNSFKTSPTKYVIGAEYNGDTYYFYSCANTDANNGNGGCTTAPATNAPIQFTLSGTDEALVATSTEVSARYLKPLTDRNFQMSATSKTVTLNDDGTINHPSADTWSLRFNTTEKYLRWYGSATGNAAYFYEVVPGASVSYRTSCCTNNVAAPTVTATNTAYTVTLTWGAVVGATGYQVSWNGGAFEAATSPCVKSGLTASTDYTYKVRATYDPEDYCGALVASGNVTTDDVYTVTYSGGTGTGSCSPSGSVATVSYEAGATVSLAATNSFSLTSHTFAAWVVKDADDNDVVVSSNQFTMPAKNVTVTATWTPAQDKYYDRMHDGTDDSHGGVADGEGKYYLVREGCNYTVPALTDDDDGETACHTTHFKLLGWIAGSHLNSAGQVKSGEESYIFQGGGTKSATGATYYAVWAIMTE